MGLTISLYFSKGNPVSIFSETQGKKMEHGRFDAVVVSRTLIDYGTDARFF
jgi:hypothetical protein